MSVPPGFERAVTEVALEKLKVLLEAATLANKDCPTVQLRSILYDVGVYLAIKTELAARGWRMAIKSVACPDPKAKRAVYWAIHSMDCMCQETGCMLTSSAEWAS